MHPVGKSGGVQKVSWNSFWHDTFKLLPQIPQNTSLKLEPDTNGIASSIPDVDISEEARTKLQALLDKKYPQIILQNAVDIGRTNLIELDVPTEDLPIASNLTQFH